MDYINNVLHGNNLELFKLIPDNSIDLIITSPPYPGVNNMWEDLFKAENFNEAHSFLNQVWDECLRVLKNGCKLCINIANTKRRPYLPNTFKIYQWAENKIESIGEIIWNKGYGQCGTAWGSYCNPSDPALADQHEYILIFRKFGDREKKSGYFLSAKKFKSWRNSIWNIPPAKASKLNHVAPFPDEIPYRLISLYSYEDEVILDPFAGSGQTILAAIELNRKYTGMEIKDEYVELINKRIDVLKSQPLLFN